MTNRAKLSILLIFQLQISFSQYQLGLRTDNWAGISALALNPAAGATAAQGWQVNVLSGGGFMANDIFYIGDAGVLGVLSHPLKVASAPKLGWFESQNPLYYFDFFNRTTEKYGTINANFNLPSVQFNFSNGQSIAAVWNARFALSSHNVPALADAYVASAVPLRVKTFIPPFKLGALAWQEMGLNYAFSIGDPLENALTFGITAKRILGYQAFFLENFGTWYTRWLKDSTEFHNVNLVGGFTDNILSNPTQRNGKGWSFDIGAQFTLGSGEWDEKPYQARFSVAITDVGKVTFSRNAQVHLLRSTIGTIIFNKGDYKDIDANNPIPDALKRINDDLYGTQSASLISSGFSLSLPTTLLAQADFALTPQYFVNVFYSQRLPPKGRFVQSDNVLALTPRKESALWTVALPISLFEFQQVRIGLSARYGYLSVGTDDLASLFGKNYLTSGDLYMSLKINPLKRGKLKSNDRNGLSLPRRGAAKCYRF